MKSKLLSKLFKLQVVERESVYILRKITPRSAYDSEGKKLDVVEGYTYTVVNTGSFETYEIKVEGSKPLMSPELLDEKIENAERVFVEFENATIRAYWNARQNCYCDSVKADGIHCVEPNDLVDLTKSAQ